MINTHKRIMMGKSGFTLVELLVVMAVFIVVIMITGDAFKTILSQTAKVFRSEESNIEGVIGLEMLRHDIQQGGYGLFTETSPVSYSEAADSPASNNNETSNTAPPRAFVFRDNVGAGIEDTTSESGNQYTVIEHSDYLTIKGLTTGISATAQKWTYLNNNLGVVTPNKWVSAAENLVNGERAILLQRVMGSSGTTLTLVSEPTTGLRYFPFSGDAFSNYSINTPSYVVYGLNKPSNSGDDSRMPFNRVDYFVARPSDTGKVPSVCASNAGILYKAAVNQSDGKLTYYPILDCVADMQVVLGWDLLNGIAPGNDGVVDTWSDADGHTVTTAAGASYSATVAEVQAALLDPATLRNSLKMIEIYVLAQNGRRDNSYISPSPIIVGGAGEESLSNSVDIAAAGWQNYRWKLYRIVVRPKNLLSNQ